MKTSKGLHYTKVKFECTFEHGQNGRFASEFGSAKLGFGLTEALLCISMLTF